MNADLILFNGQFHTVDRENPRASAVAISQGRFVAVGTDAQAMALRGSGTQVIDLKGRSVWNDGYCRQADEAGRRFIPESLHFAGL